MTGLDRILDDIRAQADAAAAQILADAEMEAAGIRGEAKKRADAACGEILAQGEKKAAEAKERAHSYSALMGRRQVLAKKQEILRDVFAEALAQAERLPEHDYFDLILRMVAANAHPGEEGSIAFSAKDLARLPGNFAERLLGALPQGSVLQIAKEPAPITGGFTLSYGGIEENCSFESILEAKKEELQDRVCAILFPAQEPQE